MSTDINEQFKLAMDMVVQSALQINLVKAPLEAFIEGEKSSHNFMHITDPTMYRKMINSQNIATNLRVSKAAVAFVKEVMAAAEEQQNAKREN